MLSALDLQSPDRVPTWELIINEPVIKALAGPISPMDFIESEDLDGITIFEDMETVRWLDENTYVDEWGIKWKVEPSGLLYPGGGPLKSREDLADYSPPDPHKERRISTLKEAVDRFGGERAIVFLSHESFEFSHYLWGMKNLLIDYHRNPSFARRLARMVTDYKKELIKAAIDAGADAIVTGDDYSNRMGPIMTVDQFREFILPYLREMIRTTKRRGVPFIKHTDGNIWPLMDMMVDAGIDAIDPLEPVAGMDIGRAKREYGDRLCLMGNIDCGQLLSNGKESEVVSAVRRTIAEAAPGGGYVLASSNSIHPAVKPDNYAAMVEAGRSYGRYPISG
jgi:uroporphyrinogen decarboxylase